MKKTLLLSTLLISIFSFSQIQKFEVPKSITIGKVKSAGTFLADLTYTIEDGDTTYRISYNNAEYSHITDIQSVSFSSEGNTLNELYDLFISTINKPKDEQATFKLGSQMVGLTSMRQLGIKVLLISPEKGYFMVTEKQINKLFNK
jgi:hypothetical protein